MKAIICAIALALVPTAGIAADMHAFDYTGNGNPVPLTAAPQTLSVQAPAAIPTGPSVVFLTRDSDFAKFVKADVPLETHRQAMRLLWQTHPEFGRALAEDTLAVGYLTVPTQSAAAASDSSVVAALAD